MTTERKIPFTPCVRCGKDPATHPLEPDFECRDCFMASCVPMGPEDHNPDCRSREMNFGTRPPRKCAETTLDSGHRKVFESGAQRDAPAGKGRYDLISPLSMRRLALVMERGAAKYSERNWEKGMPLSQFMNSALRHIYQYIAGQRDEDHLAQAMWNLHCAIHTEEQVHVAKLPSSLADLPDYSPPAPVPCTDLRKSKPPEDKRLSRNTQNEPGIYVNGEFVSAIPDGGRRTEDGKIVIDDIPPVGPCAVCRRVAPLDGGECPDCRH